MGDRPATVTELARLRWMGGYWATSSPATYTRLDRHFGQQGDTAPVGRVIRARPRTRSRPFQRPGHLAAKVLCPCPVGLLPPFRSLSPPRRTPLLRLPSPLRPLAAPPSGSSASVDPSAPAEVTSGEPGPEVAETVGPSPVRLLTTLRLGWRLGSRRLEFQDGLAIKPAVGDPSAPRGSPMRVES